MDDIPQTKPAHVAIESSTKKKHLVLQYLRVKDLVRSRRYLRNSSQCMQVMIRNDCDCGLMLMGKYESYEIPLNHIALFILFTSFQAKSQQVALATFDLAVTSPYSFHQDPDISVKRRKLLCR